MRILLAEDNDLMLQALTDCIEAKVSDCKLFTATNGSDAASMLDYRQIDLVITDWDMPGGGGAIVTAKAKALGIPAYIHSGSLNIRDVNAKGIIQKGTKMDNIIRLIEAERV